IDRRGAIFAGARIIVKAKQQELIDRIPNLVLGSLYKSKPQITRRIFDAKKVSSQFSSRSQNHDGAGVSKLSVAWILLELKSNGSCQLFDGFAVAGKKVPALFRSFFAIEMHVLFFIGCRETRSIAWVKTDRKDGEVF